MNGNDRFLNVNDAHLRVTGGNVHASSFNLDQISITTTSTTSSTIDFLNETKAFNARSNIEVGTANLFVDTTTSNVGIHTSSPEYALDVHGPANVSVLTAASNVGILTTSPEYALDVHGTANVGVLTANTVTGFDGTLFLGSHLLPTQHQQFDIGSAEKKIRHLFLSDNSLWIGDETKISVVDQKLKFLKRNKNIVPSGTIALGGNQTAALEHAQTSNPGLGLTNINEMKLEHWLAYTKTLPGGEDKDIKDIFTTDTSNYESVTASEAFKEYDDTNIYSLNKLRLGDAAAADATLDVVGTIKATSDLTVNTNTFHVDATNSRVGVGTTSPTAQLEIHGIGQTSETTFDQTGSMGGVLALKSDDGAAGSGGAVMFGSHAGFHAAIKASLEDGTSNTRGRLAFFTRSSTTDTTMSHAMTIADGGNVGIGTTSPSAKLHINSSSGSDGIAIFNPNGGTGGNLNVSAGVRGGILISNAGGGLNAADKYSSQPIILNGGGTSATNGNLRGGSIWSMWGGSQYGLAFKGASDGDAVPEGGTDPNVFITSDKVGVGTHAPGAKLEIGHYGNAIGDLTALRMTNHATDLHGTVLTEYNLVVSDIASGTGLGNGHFSIAYRDDKTDNLSQSAHL